MSLFLSYQKFKLLSIKKCLNTNVNGKIPWFKNYGLNDDRISVVIYRYEEDKLGCIALAKRSNYESTIVKSLMDTIPFDDIYTIEMLGKDVCF